MKKQKIIIAVWITAILLSTGLATSAPQLMIEEIRFDSFDSGLDRITFKMNGAHLPSTFALKGERPRVIFDFPNTVPSKAVQNSMNADGKYISRIRIGIHRGDKPKTRVVFDLTSNDPVEFKQKFDVETNTLVISVFAPGTELSTPETPQKDTPADAAVDAAEPQAPAVPEQETVQTPVPGTEPEQIATVPPPHAVDFVPPQQETVTEPPEQEAETPVQSEKKEEVVQQTDAAVVLPKPEPSPDTPDDESTVIQPLSEIGEQDAAPSGPPTLYSIEFDKDSNRGEMIIFKLSNFNPPVVFGIEEEIPRIVCFFKGTNAGEQLRDLINSKGRFVKTIRVGKYRDPDNIRVVLDLVPDRNYDLQQVFFKEDNMFMIIIDTAGEK
ncbi:MAG: AMIN domain-containing protein [Candidatus Marinimicrobia bacterium]|nr:AMIN domain-containing protein [Candidatus Neomarinimicrobiota bacterium]